MAIVVSKFVRNGVRATNGGMSMNLGATDTEICAAACWKMHIDSNNDDMREIILSQPLSDSGQAPAVSVIIKKISGDGQIQLFKQDGTLVMAAAATETGNLYNDITSDDLTLLAEGVTPGQVTLDISYTISYTTWGDQVVTQTATDTLNITVVGVYLTPDYNHDRKIDSIDKDFSKTGEPFRFWVNDDNDEGEVGRGNLPLGEVDENADCNNSAVDGVKDLIDLFPIYLDIRPALELMPPDEYKYVLENEQCLNFAYGDKLTAATAGEYLLKPGVVGADGTMIWPNFSNMEMSIISSSFFAVELDETRLSRLLMFSEDMLILAEATKKSDQNNLTLTIRRRDNDGVVLRKDLRIISSSVEDMFTTCNIRNTATSSPILTNPTNVTTNANLKSDKHFVFVHGYNVSELQARGWFAEAFKRMYWSGSLADFHGVSWEGNESQTESGSTPEYHTNVLNALESGDRGQIL